VVARDALERANCRLYTTQTIANEFVGAPVGGGLFALAAASPLLLVTACYGLAATLASLRRVAFRPAQREPWSLRLVDSEVREGLRWFWGHRLLHALGVKAA
jgi:hypothetical protein